MYDNMKFPEPEFREFPKWVTPEGGKAIIVNDADEEALVMATGEAPVDLEDERKRLAELGELHGVKIDKRWAVEKMAAAITAAGFDASFDPRA